MQGLTQKIGLYLPEAQRHPRGEMARRVQVCTSSPVLYADLSIMICLFKRCPFPGTLVIMAPRTVDLQRRRKTGSGSLAGYSGVVQILCPKLGQRGQRLGMTVSIRARDSSLQPES